MQTQSTWRLIWPVILTLVIPMVVGYFVYPDTHLPPGFGVFPPEWVGDAPGFNLYIFVLVAILGTVCLTFLFKPQWFGFKGASYVSESSESLSAKRFPWWFWASIPVTLFFWWLMWSRESLFGSLIYYAFTPLWYGFIFFLDGIVYYRTGGRSLAATRPTTFVIALIVSLIGWTYFEFFDYYILSNWYYPNGFMPELSHAAMVTIFLVAYTTVWIALFEWYTLLNTFPGMVTRYQGGPKINIPAMPLMLAGFLMLAAMTIWPKPMFWSVWISTLAVFSGILLRDKIWNPLSAMAEGNWTPAVLIALSSVFNGFFWEMWNYGSAHPDPSLQTNPNYWVYNVPYVNVIHLFSDMPLLGYFGYLPFGILVWVIFIWAGKVFGFRTDLALSKDVGVANEAQKESKRQVY